VDTSLLLSILCALFHLNQVPAVLRGTLYLTVVYDPPPDDFKRRVALEGRDNPAVMITSPTSKAPVNMGAVQVRVCVGFFVLSVYFHSSSNRFIFTE